LAQNGRDPSYAWQSGSFIGSPHRQVMGGPLFSIVHYLPHYTFVHTNGIFPYTHALQLYSKDSSSFVIKRSVLLLWGHFCRNSGVATSCT
jgi:hypothetical protein